MTDVSANQCLLQHVLATGVLSDLNILHELEVTGNVVITDFKRSSLSNSSYDVSLGPWFYRESERPPAYMCPWNPDQVKEYWRRDPEEASTVTSQEEALSKGCQVGDRIIVVGPGDTILAHTNEFIGGRSSITTMMKARSSLGRTCVTMCKDAGWGDIGYVNRWTMEIQNTGKSSLVLIVGQRVAQIVFFRTGATSRSYEKGGSYQGSSCGDITHITASWVPSMMLPCIARDATPT